MVARWVHTPKVGRFESSLRNYETDVIHISPEEELKDRPDGFLRSGCRKMKFGRFFYL